MRLYEGDSKDFIEEAEAGVISSRLECSYYDVFHTLPSQGELLSWKNSLKALAGTFDSLGFHDHGILLEYQLPYASKRLDCMISGKDSEDNDQAVIIELKQWSSCRPALGANEVTVRFAEGDKEVLHPSAQVGQYSQYLKGVNTAFYESTKNAPPVSLSACAYLHNYEIKKDDPLFQQKFSSLLKQYPAFIKGDTSFSDFLQSRLSHGHGDSIIRRISQSPIHTNQKLMENVADVIHGKEVYHLLDEQKAIYDKIMALVQQAFQERRRKAIIVKGGPGTGKSVIALNLIEYIISQLHLEAHYATGSRAFTETLRKIIGRNSQYQFKYFNQYRNTGWGKVPVIICDEAHRIRKTSEDRFTRLEDRTGKPQIDEILDAGEVCVFFIDDDQVVRPNEIGNSEYIIEHARAKGNFDIAVEELETEFRCAGSKNFIDWIDNTLEISSTDSKIWDSQKEEFDFKIMDSPDALEKAIREKVKMGFTGRIMAGFCWPWAKSLGKNGKLKNDVIIGDYQRPWNAQPSMKGLPPDIPVSNLWAYDPHGINQIGCIYTAQGFEFDYAGVIFGKDLIYDPAEGHWVGHPEASKDISVKNSKDRFLELVKRTYRVLLSRGMKGCYVYFIDEDSKNYVSSKIKD